MDLKVDLNLWGLQVIEAPPWLAAVVVLGSGTASQLVDYFLLFKWSARIGGLRRLGFGSSLSYC